MKIQLEMDDYRFATTRDDFPIGPFGQNERRWLIVMVAGKQFHVQHEIEPQYLYRRDAKDEIDKVLIKTMELMLESIMLNAAAALPEGVIETRCPSGELWRFHYEAKCNCKPQGETK